MISLRVFLAGGLNLVVVFIVHPNSQEIDTYVLGFYSRSMESIVAFSQCFIIRVNLRLTSKELEEDLRFLARGFCVGVLPS